MPVKAGAGIIPEGGIKMRYGYKGIFIVMLLAVGFAAWFFLAEEKTYGEAVSVGLPAPAFEYTDTDGKIWRLSDLRGKVVFLNFWATWCPACKSEMPSKEALHEKMKGRPFQMLGILFRDDPANLVPYFKKQHVGFPTLITRWKEAARLYGIIGIPQTFIIDRDGIVRERIVGPREWDSPEALAMIEKWL